MHVQSTCFMKWHYCRFWLKKVTWWFTKIGTFPCCIVYDCCWTMILNGWIEQWVVGSVLFCELKVGKSNLWLTTGWQSVVSLRSEMRVDSLMRLKLRTISFLAASGELYTQVLWYALNSRIWVCYTLSSFFSASVAGFLAWKLTFKFCVWIICLFVLCSFLVRHWIGDDILSSASFIFFFFWFVMVIANRCAFILSYVCYYFL